MSKSIKLRTDLTQAQLKSQLFYDPIVGIFIRRSVNTPAIKLGSIAGGINVHGYVTISVLGKLYLAHRLAWLYMTGKWPEADIDHKNGVRTDNRWSNIRKATRSQNLQNTAVRSDNTSGIKGVSWCKKTNKWRAYIQVNKKTVIIDYFTNRDDAARARKEAEQKRYGEFARVA